MRTRQSTYRLYRNTKTKLLNISTSLILVASSIGGTFPLMFSQQAMAVTPTVTPASLSGWTVTNSDGGTATFVTDSTAPVGTGALQLTTTSSNNSRASLTRAFDLPLSGVSALSFKTKQLAAADTTNGNITLRINVDTTGDGTFDDQLMYEPYYNGFNGNATTSWQTWDAANGKLWSNYEKAYNGLGAVGAGSYDSNFTLADVLASFPSAKVTGLTVSMGTWNPSQTVLADEVTLNDTTFNFDQAAITPCATTTLLNSTTFAGWELSQTRTAGSNVITENGLRVTATPSTGSYANEFSKAVGYHATNFPLSEVGVPDITIAAGYTGTRPSLQIGVDKDNNGSWDGYLVYEPWSYGTGNYWSSKNFGIAAGMGYTSFGTLNDYLNANPNARVTSIGYSLGSGVVGDAVITKLSVGCVDYTFNLPSNTAPTVSFASPTPAENASVRGTVTAHVTATDDYGMGSYYVRVWKNAFESGTANLVYNSCWSAPGAANLGTTQDVTCAFDTTSWSDGKYVISAQFQDSHIVWGQALRTIYVDNTAPTLTVKPSPDTLGSGPYSKISFKLYDGGSKIDKVVINGVTKDLTDNNWSDVNGVKPGVFGAIEGSNTIVAYDVAGNTTTLSFVLDTTAPSSPTNLSWKTSSNTTVADGGFTNLIGGTAQWEAGSSDTHHYVYKYWNDIVGNTYKIGGEYTVDVSNTNLAGVFNQGEGVHHFCVAAVDALGNTSACSSAFSITYDKTKPTVALNAPAASASVTSPVTVSVTASDETALNRVTANIYSGATLVKSCSTSGSVPVGGTTYMLTCSPAALAPGAYTIRYNATDRAGNISNTTTTAFTVAAAAPGTGEGTQGGNNSNNGNNQTNNNAGGVTTTNNQVANPGNAANVGNTNAGAAQADGVADTQGAVLGANTNNAQVKGAATSTPTVTIEKAAAKKNGAFLGLGWWWIVILVGLTGFWFLLAAKRRKQDEK